MELLIIVPFKEVSEEIPVQEDSAWVDIANILAGYKTRTGISTEVTTLDEINESYEGRDEAERVKYAIYDGVLNHDVRYVMLVGDAGLFPTRYILRGYTTLGEIIYDRDTDDPFNMYRFSACDAYFANLWHSDDSARAFDDWDADGDGIFGESYLDNIRGIDGHSIHPQVSLGRVPCKNPLEFQTYVNKVIIYENRVSIASRRNEVLLVSGGDIGFSGDCNSYITSLLESDYDVTNLRQEPDRSYTVEDAGGTTSPVVIPNRYINRFIETHHPKFVSHTGHGRSDEWSEVAYRISDARLLSNVDLPMIMTSTGCETAMFATDQRLVNPPTLPFTGTDSVAIQDSMAEALLTQGAGGAVIYVGGVVGTRAPACNDFIKSLYQSIADGTERIGDAWRATMEAFIISYELDDFTTSEHMDVWDEWPAPRPDFVWDPLRRTMYFHIFLYHLFGDPSLRVNGLTLPDRRPPVTTATLDRWVNKAALEAVLSGGDYVHEVSFSAADRGSSGIASTYSRYRLNSGADSGWSAWNMGGTSRIVFGPGEERLRAGMDGRSSDVEYFSVDLLGNTERPNTATFGYDFTPPRSEVIINGEPVPSGVEGEITYLEPTITIRAADENSGLRSIYYSLNSAGGSPGHGSRPFDRVPGPSFDVPLSPCFRGPFALTFWAEDEAGNLEEPNHLAFSIGSSLELREELICFGRLIERPYQFPPRLQDELIDLVFTEKISVSSPMKCGSSFLVLSRQSIVHTAGNR